MNDLIDFTPELRAQALEVLKRYRWEESPYVPLIVGNVNGKLGTINIGNTAGGVNWPGSAFDPETGWFYTQASNSQVTVGSLAPPPPGFSDLPYQQGVVGQPFRLAMAAGTGTNPDAPGGGRGAQAQHAARRQAPLRRGARTGVRARARGGDSSGERSRRGRTGSRRTAGRPRCW